MNLLPTPFLSAAIIAKNEARFLPDCLRSLHRVVDEIVVLDTGSTDDTVAIAAGFGAKVFHHEWKDDFSEARNASIQKCTGRWVLIIDCDEYLRLAPGTEGGLKKALLDFEAQAKAAAAEAGRPEPWPVLLVKLAVIDKDAAEAGSYGMHKQFRLFPRSDAIFYESPIHNRLTIEAETKATTQGGVMLEIASEAAHLVHRGYDPEVRRSQKKAERAFRILDKALKERPDALNHFYLGREHFHEGHWEQAYTLLDKARLLLEASDSPLERHHLEGVYLLLLRTIPELLSDFLEAGEADALMEKACKAFPQSPDIHNQVGVLHLHSSAPEAALKAFQDAIAVLPYAEAQEVSYLAHRPWQAHYNASQAYLALGRHQEAQDALRQVVALGDGEPEVGLVQDLLDGLDDGPPPGRVHAGMASFPPRLPQLLVALESILPQVDKLTLYLNGYDTIPEQLANQPKLEVLLHPLGDLRDTGKFVGAVQNPGFDFYLTLDDDIVYPQNYVSRLVSRIVEYKELGDDVVVGVHGSTLVRPVSSYIRDRAVRHCAIGFEQDALVDVLGTGTAAWPGCLNHLFQLERFKSHGMTDLWFSLILNRTPRISIARRDGWIKVLEVTTGTLWEEAAHGSDAAQTEIANRIA